MHNKRKSHFNLLFENMCMPFSPTFLKIKNAVKLQITLKRKNVSWINSVKRFLYIYGCFTSMVVGMPTRHDNEGTNTRKTLRSLTETEGWKASAVTSQVEDDFRERTQWQLGKTRDPLVLMISPYSPPGSRTRYGSWGTECLGLKQC